MGEAKDRAEEINGMKANGPKPKTMELNSNQLAALLVLDGQSAQLQIGANQLGSFLKLKREADILIAAIELIQKEKEKLISDWAKLIQIVPASALPPSGLILAK